MSSALLPRNATPLEAALADTAGEALSFPVPVRDVWNPDTCPVNVLPHLAWALSVDVWDMDWPEATKRAVIRESLRVHRTKGSLGSIKRVLAAAGLGDATVVEGGRFFYADGELAGDGQEFAGLADHWAEYRVTLGAPISVDEGPRVRALLEATAPARSHLKFLSFELTAFRANGVAIADGTYSAGVV